MEMEKRKVSDSIVETVHMVRPQHLNASDRLFGGALMQWIDEVAGMVAKRHTRRNVITASVDSLSFLRGAYVKDTVVIIGKVTYVGNTSMEVKVDTYVEALSGERTPINHAYFTMVALDKNDKPVRVPRLDLETEEEKEEYERTFVDEEGKIPEVISSSELNTWIFNEDTIRQALNILMTEGIKIEYGQKLGKTIIFAKNHNHAEKILEVFNKEYPYLPDYARVIDNRMTYAQSAIDEFADPKKMPQIAISVDMLDTGIDVPEILNLVFFKKVMSKAKFWQMIGRGTRLCPEQLDGEDKQKFYIFDFCGNFEFFRLNKGRASAKMIALQSAVFNLKFEITYQLQSAEYQTDRLIAYRNALVREMSERVQKLPRDNFAVRQHLKYVEMYSDETNYQALTYGDTVTVKEEVSPLIQPEEDEANAVRFDALMYRIELAYLMGKKDIKARGDLRKKVKGVAGVAKRLQELPVWQIFLKFRHRQI